MGLAASQAKYLALTARKSDLEFQSQTINTRRIQLAYRTAEIAQAYAEGMNNKQIAVSSRNENGDKVWEQATYGNLLNPSGGRDSYVVIPFPGLSWDDIDAANPYIYSTDGLEVESGYYEPKKDANNNVPSYDSLAAAIAALGLSFEENATDATKEAEVAKYCDKEGDTYKLKSSISRETFEALSDEKRDALFKQITYQKYQISTNPAVMTQNPNHAWDLQNLLEHGNAQIITKAFFDYLMSKGYDPMSANTDIGTYQMLQENFNNNKDNCNVSGKKAILDWRADQTSTINQRSYTEDDAQVLAKYEAETAEVQRQDKMLEIQVKNIETQHKAVETELEGVQKVIQQNIEKTFKIFS